METQARSEPIPIDRIALAKIAHTPIPVTEDLHAGVGRPSQEEAESAVRTLLRWAGDDPDREGLLDTPARVRRWWSRGESNP